MVSWRGLKLHGSEINSNTCNVLVKLLIFLSDKLHIIIFFKVSDLLPAMLAQEMEFIVSLRGMK